MSLRLLAIDLGKRSFHIHGIDNDGVIVSRKTSRSKLIETIEELAPEAIAMEACASAHYRGGRFLAAGHRVLLINPRFVKPFVKGSKNDAADAEEIYEAAMRPTMRRSNRLNNRIFNRFTARGTASSVPAQPLSTIRGGSLASTALFCRKARGVS